MLPRASTRPVDRSPGALLRAPTCPQSYVRNFLDLRLNPLWGNDLGVLILDSDIGKSVGFLGMQYGCSVLPMSLSLVGYPGEPERVTGGRQHIDMHTAKGKAGKGTSDECRCSVYAVGCCKSTLCFFPDHVLDVRQVS